MAENDSLNELSLAGEVRLVFDGEKKAVTVYTPGGLKVTLSDDTRSILLEESGGNSIHLSPSGIELNSAGDIALQARGKISLSAVDTISVASKMDVEVSGTNVKNAAAAEFVAKGAMAELSATTQTTVRGALVRIN